MLQQYSGDMFLHAQYRNVNMKQEPDCCESNFARSLGVNSAAAPQRII